MIILFFILSLTTVPCLYYNVSGNMLKPATKTGYFQTMTVANKKTIPFNITSKTEAESILSEVGDISIIMITSDAFFSVLFGILILLFTIYNEYRIKRSCEITLRTSLYAIEIGNLPIQDVTESELKSHFEQNYGPVAECVLVRGFTSEQFLYKNLDETNREIVLESARCKLQNKKDSKHLGKLLKKKDELEFEVHKKSIYESEIRHIEKGFIIFEYLRDKKICINSQPKCVCCSNEGFKFKGQILSITQPVEPSDIIWENMHTSIIGKIFRSIISFIVTFVVLIGSFAAIYTASRYVNEMPDESDCIVFPTDVNIDLLLQSGSKQKIFCFCANLDYVFFQGLPYQKGCGDFANLFRIMHGLFTSKKIVTNFKYWFRNSNNGHKYYYKICPFRSIKIHKILKRYS